MDTSHIAHPRPRVAVKLVRKDESPREFCPLTPPRALEIDLDGVGPKLIDRADLRFDLALVPGTYRLPLFPDDVLPVEVAPGGRLTGRLFAERGPEDGRGATVVSAAELEFDPPIAIFDIVPVLAKLPTLFDDYDLAPLLAWVARAREARIAGLSLADLGKRLGRFASIAIGSATMGGEARSVPDLGRLREKLRSTASDLAHVLLRRVVFEPVRRGATRRLEPRFSGLVIILENIPFAFDGVRLPHPVIPVLHAEVERLFSSAPLATATLHTERLKAESLADGIAAMIGALSGSFDVAARLPGLDLSVLLPDQGLLGVDLSTAAPLAARGHFSGRIAPDEIEVLTRDFEARADGRDLSLEATLRLGRTGGGASGGEGGGEGGGGPRLAGRLLAAMRTRHLREQGISAALSIGIRPGTRLPPLEVGASVRHAAIRGGIDLRATLRDLTLEGKAELSLDPAAERPVLSQAAGLSFSCAAELHEGTRFDDGATRLDLAGTSARLSGKARLGDAFPAEVEIGGEGSVRVRGARRVAAFPELAIEEGEVRAALEARAVFEAAARARKRGASLVEVDFAGTRARLTFESAGLDLGRRSLVLPAGGEVEGRLREAVLAASGLGRSTIDVAWDLEGRSPLLGHDGEAVELFVPALRKGAIVVELGPAGGLTITGERGGLYDAPFFNALLNPGADLDRLADLVENDEAMERILAAVRVFSGDAHRLLEAARRFVKRARRALDEEGIERPADAIPGRKLARLASRLLADSPGREAEVYPLVKQVTGGKGLDVYATKRLLNEIFGDHPYEFEVDRLVRWCAHVLAPTEPVPPFTAQVLPPLEESPAHRDRLRGLPSAHELHRTVDSPEPLPEGFSAVAARIAPCLTLEQIEYLLSRGRSDWREDDLRRLWHAVELKRRARMISESYGGLAFAPQSLAIAFFLGETIAMSEAPRRGGRDGGGGGAVDRLPLADTLLGPEDAAALLQAGLASVMQGRTVQMNQRMLLDHILSKPPAYLESVLVELSANNVRVLAGVLNALLNMRQSCLRAPLDLTSEFAARLGIEFPRLEDYLAGGRFAKLSYYEALNHTAERILAEAEPYLALKCHLQVDRKPLEPRLVPDLSADVLEARAREAVARADAAGERWLGGGREPARRDEARAAYEDAFAECAALRAASPEAFQRPWFKAFWGRNHEALVILSVVRNVEDDVDQVRRWLAVRTGRPVPEGEQDLIDSVIEALYHFPEDRSRLARDPLVRLLLDPPAGPLDFTIVSCMGVITEGARGTELEAAYRRIEERHGVRTIRADTATARSLEYNAARIEEAVRRTATPWGYIGYSQGCANGLEAESRLLGGTPEQQALGKRLRCRNLLFSAANGSAHGTCSDWKFLRAMVEGELFLKHYQAVLSRQAIEIALHGLRLFLDSRPFVHGTLGTYSLSHEGVRFLHREGQWKADAPTSIVRGIVEPETLPEALEWLSNVLAHELETEAHDTQVATYEAVGHAAWVRNPYADVLERCDTGCLVQRCHHWSPLVAETDFITTERDRAQAIYDFPKDRHVFPWVWVNARFGVIERRAAAAVAAREKAGVAGGAARTGA